MSSYHRHREYEGHWAFWWLAVLSFFIWVGAEGDGCQWNKIDDLESRLDALEAAATATPEGDTR